MTMYQKTYTYTEGHAHEETTSATEAMEWHRAGRRVTVWGVRPNGGHYHVTIKGMPIKSNQEREDAENRNRCRHIAEECDNYASGNVRRCPECGEEITRDWDGVDKMFRCPECGEIAEVYYWEVLSIGEYLGDAFDIVYRVTGKDYDDLRSVQIMVGCGGPNMYLDTSTKNVELYWWGKRAWYPLSDMALDAIEEWAEEQWGYLE